METSDSTPEKSTTNLDVNLAAALTYLLGFVTGIAFLVIEKDSKFVRFHAMQSTLVFLPLFILAELPFLGLFAYVVLTPLGFILWLVLMFKAYQGEKFKLPLVGDIAEQKA